MTTTRRGLLAALSVTVVAVAGCSGGTPGGESAATAGSVSQAGGKRIALMLASMTNSASQALIDGAKEQAGRDNVEITVLASDFDPQKQYGQFQDAVTTGRYDGILVQALDGASICSLVSQATAKNIKVGAVNSAIGTDFTKPESSCPGVTTSVVRPFARHGQVIGELAVEACKARSAAPCEVAFMQTAPGAPFDTAIFNAFQAQIAKNPSVQLVAKANSKATREGGLNAMQQLATAQRGLDVVVGPEQSVLGGVSAAKAAGLDPAPLLVGIGGGIEGVAAIKDGSLFGVSASVPKSEARLAVKHLAEALRTGTTTPGVDADVVAGVPGEGKVTKENVGGFTPEFHS